MRGPRAVCLTLPRKRGDPHPPSCAWRIVVRRAAYPEPVRGDGDGWVVSDTGMHYWGRHGAAGLLLRAPRPDGTPAVLLQHRAPWSHQGGTWGLPGGARDSHETPEQAAVHRAALLETCHAVGRDPATVRTSVNALVALGGSTAPPGRAALFGSAQRLIDQFGQYAEFGFDEFVLPDWNLGTDPSERADKLARIKTEVLDQVTAALRLPVVSAPAHGMAHRAQKGQNEADNQNDDADRPDDRDLRDETDD